MSGWKWDDEYAEWDFIDDDDWEPKLKGLSIGQSWVDEVQHFQNSNGELFTPESTSFIQVQNAKTGEWKVIPVKATSVSFTQTWDYVDTSELYPSLHTSIQKAIEKSLTPSPKLQQALLQSYVYGNFSNFEQYTTAVNQTVNPSKQEQNELERLFPGLTRHVFDEECPAENCQYQAQQYRMLGFDSGCDCNSCSPSAVQVDGNSYPGGLKIINWVMHLNDTHKWPRTQSDRDKKHEAWPDDFPAEGPNIRDWLKNGAEKYGWDLNCAVPATKEKEE